MSLTIRLTSARRIGPLRPGKTSAPSSCCKSGRHWFKWALQSRDAVARFPEVLANPSLNRTFCGSPLQAFISFSALRGLPQNAG